MKKAQDTGYDQSSGLRSHLKIVQMLSQTSPSNEETITQYKHHFFKGKQNPFSKREIEILKLMAEGYTSKIIGQKLFISEHTVITHRKNMQHKTGISNSTALIYFCAKNNII